MTIQGQSASSVPGARRARLGAVLGLVAVFAAVVWPRLAFFPVGPLGKVNPFTIATLAALAALAVSQLSRPPANAGKDRAIVTGLSAALLALIGLRLVSDFAGQDIAASLYLTARETAYIFSFYLIGWWVVRETSFHRLAWVLVVATYGVILLGLVEVFAGASLLGMLPSFMTETVDPLALADLLAAKLRDGRLRVQASFDHPILFAQYLAATAPLLIHRVRFAPSAWRRCAPLLALGLAVYLVYRTGSRAGLAVLGFSCVAYGLLLAYRRLSPAKLIGAYLMTIAVLAAVLVFFDDIALFFYGRTIEEIVSFNARQLMIYNARPWIELQPVLGYGDGMSVQKAGVEGFGRLVSIDNYYLTTILNFGFAGLAALLLFLGLAALTGWRQLRAAADPGEASLMAAGLCMIFAVALVQLIVSIPGNMVLVYLGAGALAGHGALAAVQGPSR